MPELAVASGGIHELFPIEYKCLGFKSREIRKRTTQSQKKVVSGQPGFQRDPIAGELLNVELQGVGDGENDPLGVGQGECA